MKISTRWLKDFVDLEIAPAQLADDLTNMGVVVETVESVGEDLVLNLDLTTNRPDCLSHFGVAREIAAHNQLLLKSVRCKLEESSEPASSAIGLLIDTPGFVPATAPGSFVVSV